MSNAETAGNRGRSIGFVTELGDDIDPRSITWLNFPSIVFMNDTSDREMPEGIDPVYSVPVSTSDLLKDGVDLEPDMNGLILIRADVNLEVGGRSDVFPSNFERNWPLSALQQQVMHRERF